MMAGNLAALYNYCDNTLNLPVSVRESIVSQGINSFDDFLNFKDKDIHKFCDNARKGSGMVANPNWQAGAAANILQNIPDPGTKIGMNHELYIRKLRYCSEYYDIVQRPFMANQASTARLNDLWASFENIKNEKAFHDLDPPVKMERQQDARATVEDIDNYLLNKQEEFRWRISSGRTQQLLF